MGEARRSEKVASGGECKRGNQLCRERAPPSFPCFPVSSTNALSPPLTERPDHCTILQGLACCVYLGKFSLWTVRFFPEKLSRRDIIIVINSNRFIYIVSLAWHQISIQTSDSRSWFWALLFEGHLDDSFILGTEIWCISCNAPWSCELRRRWGFRSGGIYRAIFGLDRQVLILR